MNPMSEKQEAFIKKLIEERTGKVNEEQQFVVDSIVGFVDSGAMSVKSASLAIDTLLGMKVEKQAQEVVAGPNAVPLGTYTVVLNEEETDYVTIRIAVEKWADGKIVASYLAGADNESAYRGFAFVNDKGLSIWKRFNDDQRLAIAANVLIGNADQAHEKFLDIAEAYAMKSGRCMRCARKLTVPASLHRGLGPECATKEGV